MPQLLELQGGLEALLLQLVCCAKGHGRKQLERASAMRGLTARKGGGSRMRTLGEATLFEVRDRASS